MARVRLLRHGPSKGGRALARELGIRMLNLREPFGRFRPRPDDLILNWGKGSPGERQVPNCQWINHPCAVHIAQNKLSTYTVFRDTGVPHPEWTTERERAISWIDNGLAVVSRTLLRASEGRGIVYSEGFRGHIPRAPLYTQYVKKADEYRLHVFNGEVFDIQQKRRRRGEEGVSNQIRSHDNGWVFCREEVQCPAVVIEAAQAAVGALRLDYGAADVGYNRRRNEAVCYEVNTAPGLEGTTLRNLADALRWTTGRY